MIWLWSVRCDRLKIDQDVLSQCGTQVSMQIQNPTDQDAIKRSVETAGEDVLRELPGLRPVSYT